MQALFSLQLYYEKTLAQESNLTISSTPFYETHQTRHIIKQAHQARYFMKHAKPAIL